MKKSDPELKSALIVEESAQQNGAEPELQPSQVLTESTFIAAETEGEKEEAANNQQPKKHQSRRWLMRLSLGLFIALLSFELVVFVKGWLSTGGIIDLGWLVLLCLVTLGAASALVKELMSLRGLNRREKFRFNASGLLEANGVGGALPLCKRIATARGDKQMLWLEAVEPHYSDREVLQVYEQRTLGKADERATALVSQHSAAVAAMVAASPLAVMDVMLVLWRSLRMINQLAECYGIQLSYWGRIGLLKRVLSLMAYAGLSELLTELGSMGLGASVSARLSAQLAQGVGAGVLSARLGLRAIDTCRPLPWIGQKKPNLSRITKALIAGVESKDKDKKAL